MAVVEIVEQSLEQVGALRLTMIGGVIVLGPQGGAELDAGLEEGEFSQMDPNAQSSSAGLVQ